MSRKIDRLLENDIKESNSSHAEVSSAVFFKAIKDYPLLTREQEIQAGKMLKSDDPAVREEGRNKLLESNLRLVISQAHKYMGHGVSLLDLIEEGVLGLAHATEKYDVDLGFRFSTYATWWIKQAIRQAIIYLPRTIYVPGHIRSQVNNMNKTRDHLLAKKNRMPTEKEIADAMHTTVKKIESIKSDIAPLDSIDTSITADDGAGTQLGDMIPDNDAPDPNSDIKNEELRKDLIKAADLLPERASVTIKMAYGLNPLHKIYPPEVIAQKLGVSRDRLRSIQKQALLKLQHPARSYNLKKYLVADDDKPIAKTEW